MGPTPASLGPRQPHLSPVLRRALVETHAARATPHPRLFKARTRNDPGRLPSARPTALRPRWKTSRKLVRLRLALRHPFTCCDGTRRRPRWWISASRYPALPRDASRRRALGVGEMLLTDFCNRHVARAPLGSLDPRGDRRAFTPLATSDGAEPQRTSRVTPCLTARRELQPPSSTRPPETPAVRPVTRVRMPSDPAGLPIVSSPRDGTPRPRRCLPWTGRT
jgi:hypothetical protein